MGFKKSFNLTLLYSSYYLSKWRKKPIVWGKPFTASIEPTTSCNLRCPECPSGLRSFSRDTGNIKLIQGKKMVDELAPSVAYINFYFQGEPLISPHFFDLVSYAHSKKIYTATSTNAHFLSDENCQKIIDSGLNRLIISIDGTTQETYSQYRREGTLEKVLEGTRNIIKHRKMNGKGPYIIFQFLVVKPNEHQTEDILHLAKEIGVDEVKFKTAQLYDYKHGHELMPDNPKFSRYQKKADGTYKPIGKQENSCWRMWSSCVITWDGNAVPCCFDKDAKYQMGNILNTPFKTIWKSDNYTSFRFKLLNGRNEIDICANCSEGTKVWA
jgi:radical SAM protein with 4Fe4S-binding SPASM domain